MVTREARIAEFNSGTPTSGVGVDVLCQDHNGTYTLPFACKWDGSTWRNAKSGHAIEVNVVGWREW